MVHSCLVTGANGHLGNNLVRILHDKGENVRASVRNVNYTEPFEGLDCEVVYADILDRKSLSKAMERIDIIYQVAAVYKMWAKDPQKDIIDMNIRGTENVLETAKKQGVKKIVYVSSIAALDHSLVPMDETSWNSDFSIPYYQSKTESEKLALGLAEKLDIQLISVLPTAMVGPNCFGHLTPTMEILYSIINNKLSVDPNLYFNFVDVRDVAKGMIAAAEKGRNGERYILGTEVSISTTKIIDMAQSLLPDIKKPAKRSRNTMMILAFLMETISKFNGKPPAITLGIIKSCYGTDQSCNISKARRELGYNPVSPYDALKEALFYLLNKED